MAGNIKHFLNVVSEIEKNSWWQTNFATKPLDPLVFTYTVDSAGSRITEVPSEPFEALLLRVRRLTMNDSAENLLKIRAELGRSTVDANRRTLLDSWFAYWRIAFIKEPLMLQMDGRNEIVTPYRVYDSFINGHFFHSNDPKLNIILYGQNDPAQIGSPSLFLRNIFHATVVSFCCAALGLKLWIESDRQMILSGHVKSVADYVWYRNQIPAMNEQYKVFNDWIRANGDAPKCRWS